MPTNADRVLVELLPEYGVDGQEAFYLTHSGDDAPFGVSRCKSDPSRRTR